MSHDLQLDGLAIKFDGPDFLRRLLAVVAALWDVVNAYEVDTDCGDVGLGVGVVGEPQQQARLSNTGVTDEEQLEEVVVSMRRCQLGLVAAIGGWEGLAGSLDAGADRERERERERGALGRSVSTSFPGDGQGGGVEAAYYSGFMVMAVLLRGGGDDGCVVASW